MLNSNQSIWPKYSLKEIWAVIKVLMSKRVNYWTGFHGREFEKEYAQWAGTKYAVCLSNGTIALESAFKAINLNQGDEVIVTSRTFIASISSIVNVGGKPVFADVSLETQNLLASEIKSKITPKTKAILCVHLAGWPCDMSSIMKIAKEKKIFVVEDCSQAHGATYKGKSVGSIGDIGCWSFCQDKIITTGGEGGMITTNNKKIWKKIWEYKDHGKNFDIVHKSSKSYKFKWVHSSFGSNYRMTELQSAIGRIQLKKVNLWQQKRIRNARKIWNVASKYSSIRVPSIPDYINHAAYRCYIFVESNNLKKGWDRDKILIKLNQSGIPCNSGSCSEVYLEKAFQKYPEFIPQERLPNAKKLGNQSISFLVHPNLSAKEVNKTCEVLEGILKQITKEN